MTINEFREKYPEHQVQTTMRHYQPKTTIKVGFFKTVTSIGECIVEAKIISDKGLTVSTGMAYGKNRGADDFLQETEDEAILSAILNLITKKELK